MTQRFKENDENELIMINLALPTLAALGVARDDMEVGAFECFKLGGVLWDLGRDPMADVITRELFASSFFAIHQLFTRPGTYEFYLEVFRAVFGPDVDVEFVNPDPGVLEINIDAEDLTTFRLQARQIVDGEYVYYDLVTSDGGDFIMGQGTSGARTQAEIDALINEISPNGIFTTCTLVVGP